MAFQQDSAGTSDCWYGHIPMLSAYSKRLLVSAESADPASAKRSAYSGVTVSLFSALTDTTAALAKIVNDRAVPDFGSVWNPALLFQIRQKSGSSKNPTRAG